MKLPRISIAFFALFLVGATIFSFHLKRLEDKQRIMDVQNRGNYLVSLISLYPILEFDAGRRDFFFRTLTEYTSNEGFVYLFVHDNAGEFIVSLAPESLLGKIPKNIQEKSVYAPNMKRQTYTISDNGVTIFEFAKPIFENGQRAGTVRLGLKFSPVSLLSPERISLLAMIIFFIFAALAIGYYGITLALRPLRDLNLSMKEGLDEDALIIDASEKIGRITPIIQDLEDSLMHIKDRLKRIEYDNVDLTSKLGVATFEKNKILKILDSINFGVIINDIQENVDHINKYMLNLLNQTREEVVDRPFYEVIDNNEIVSFVSQHELTRQSMTIDNLETLFPEIQPGEVFKITTTYLMGGANAPVGKIISFHNVTLESLAKRAQHQFTAHVAHEIVTPLTNIKSYSEMLMDGEVEDVEMQKEFHNIINEQTNRLADMIKNLLDISKMEMGSLTLDKGLLKTEWLFEDCISSIEASALEKNITIVKNQPDLFPNLFADKDLMKTAIINILGNALKYTPENGYITFSISEKEDVVIFDISDTGHGISQEDLPHVFEKFYRSDNPKISDKVGSGLGLAITAEIVQLHDGTIDVESDLGKGTQFTITIPKEEYYIGKE
ncbi:sensor histidine kinase [Thermodesulfobacteriota bacterium]